MKKICSFLLCLIILAPMFSSFVGAADINNLDAALKRAEYELYGLYTSQSLSILRDCYRHADTTGDRSLSAAINSYVDSLVPLENYIRAELMGFSTLSENDLAKMKYSEGSLSVSGDFITLSGDGKLRYSNASINGIVGVSPFGMPMTDCDGLVMKITADTDCLLTLEVGRRGGENDCSFMIGDVRISATEKYYFFDFELFGELPLDGTLNYISLSFDGASSVTFGELHAANNTETAVEKVYSETPVKSAEFNPKNYYKILQKDKFLRLFQFANHTFKQRIF